MLPFHVGRADIGLWVIVLHITTFETLEEAIEINNSVDQGLSSALYTQ